MTTIFNSQWVLVVAFTALNTARPSSPEFLSSLVLSTGDGIWLRVRVTILPTAFRAYILLCFVRIGQLIFGPMTFFMFTIPDFARDQRQEKRETGSDDENTRRKPKDNRKAVTWIAAPEE